ncbi:MAG: peptide-methionine (S)-S-oxide reductase MsrA [Flavobacteriaceae bacterium]|nr:peptide-methionine (S)-S-oxide reductase MsrA [Flavobacteriaceae bacterium]MCY4254114.1 peptide-methionine (S)-S-oxide reductase MsrA [Flavobacteriaceae bacterium]
MNPLSVDKSTLKVIQTTQKAYFASGCFWCVELIFESLRGVEEVYSGYSGGHTKNPTYAAIGSGQTGHAETVEIIYNPQIISFETLLDVFFGSHDPTTLNKQGPDKGTQYRSIAFYQTEKQKQQIENHIEYLTKNIAFKNPIVTQVLAFEKFYYAEEYHQDFERKNPNHPYVRRVSIPRFNQFAANYPELLKD